MTNNGKVSIWISVPTLGFEVANVIAKGLMTHEDNDKYEVHMMPSLLTLTDELANTIKQADLMLLGDLSIAPNSPSSEQHTIEKTIFPVGYSKYKTAIAFVSEETHLLGVKNLKIPNVNNKAFTFEYNSQLCGVVNTVLREVNDILKQHEEESKQTKTYNIGVAIELLKTGMYTVSKLSWSGTKTLKIYSATTGEKCIRLYDAESDMSMAWIPEPSDLMDEDYYTC